MWRFTPLPLLLALAGPLAAAPVDPDPKSLAVPAETAVEATALVSKLGSRSFAEREQATQEVKKLGRLALPALDAALKGSKEPEARMRVEMLLPAAQADDFRARVECFLADAEGKYDHDLPSAKPYFAAAGRSDAAKVLFRAIVQSPNRDLLQAIGKAEELPRLVVDRKAEFQRRLNAGVLIVGGGGVAQPQPAPVPPTAADLAAIFFAESTVPEKALGAPPGSQATTLLHQPAMRAALAGGPEQEPMANIVTAWAATREEPQTLYYAMNALRANLPAESLKLAGRVLAGKAAVPTQRGMAMGVVAQHGGPADHATLLPFLKDETVLVQVAGAVPVPGAAGQRVPLQARDAALALLLVATKQNPDDYGLTFRFKGNANPSDTLKYSYVAYYFDGAEADANAKRAAAFKKWDAWLADHKDALAVKK